MYPYPYEEKFADSTTLTESTVSRIAIKWLDFKLLGETLFLNNRKGQEWEMLIGRVADFCHNFKGRVSPKMISSVFEVLGLVMLPQ